MINPPTTPFTVGNTYTVNWLGTEYEVVAADVDGSIVLGNLSIIEMGNDTFEPFLIGIFPNGDAEVYTKESITEGNISIKGENAHKLDMKYLPEIQNKNILDGSANGSIRTIGANTEIGEWAFAEGYYTTASGNYSHAEGSFFTTASGESSHAEGFFTTASGESSHAEGFFTTASGSNSHAEGYYATVSGDHSHAEGWHTTASGDSSHAEGSETTASGHTSHAEGANTIASGMTQHVQGKYNIEDIENKYSHIVGNGSYIKRSNAHTLDWEGNAWFAGNVYVGGTSQDNSDKLATEKKVETSITSPKDYFALTDIDNGYTYIVQMKNGNLVSRCGVSSIEVTTMPDKIEYYAGEYFDDSTGMVVTAICEDGSVIEITNYTCSDNQFIIGGNTVTISYDEAGNTYTTTITVNAIEFDAATILIDFEYTDNGDGTYTITAWKGTKNGVASTEMVVPDSSKIIL